MEPMPQCGFCGTKININRVRSDSHCRGCGRDANAAILEAERRKKEEEQRIAAMPPLTWWGKRRKKIIQTMPFVVPIIIFIIGIVTASLCHHFFVQIFAIMITVVAIIVAYVNSLT